MPVPLVTQHYPDDFQVLTFQIRAFSSGDLLFYADRDIVIDSITFSIQTAGGAGATLQLAKSTVGTVATPSTGAAAHITGGTALHATAFAMGSGATVPATEVVSLATPSSDTNLVKAGNFVGVIVAGTIGTPDGIIQVRFRSRVA